jgi:predicted 2-oxoglutarate/Fe(II)-dependent dioxygenase YbiX
MRMSRSDLNTLRALGLYLHEGFLSPIACCQLRRDVQAGAAEAATIIGDGGDVIIDQTVRRAESFDITDAGLRTDVSRQFDTLLPGLAAHYGVALSGYEAPYVVRYPTGGFYRPHTDNDEGGHGSPETSHRKVSCVVFLNGTGPAAQEDSFAGGALAFFRLANRPNSETCKTFLYPEPNLLVAFRSGVCHEVLPVMAGCRWTLVTWFH